VALSDFANSIQKKLLKKAKIYFKDSGNSDEEKLEI